MKTVSLQKQMAWNGIGNLIYLFAQWLVTVLVTRFGEFQEAGVLSLAMSVSATFQTFALFGIRNFQISDLKGEYGDTSYVSFRGWTCVGALLLCLGFSLITGYRNGQLVSILFFMLFRLSENYCDVLHGILQKNNRLDFVGKSFAARGIGGLGVFAVGYFVLHSMNLGLLFMALLSWGVTAGDWFFARKYSVFAGIGKLSQSFGLIQKSWILCVYSFFFAALSTTPKLVLEKVCNEEILGAYSGIFAPALLVSAVAGYLYSPFIPSFAKELQEKNRKIFLKLFIKLLAFLFALFAVVLICGALFGNFALRLVFGDKILEYASYLTLILVGISVNVILAFFCALEIVFRDSLWLLISCAAGFLLELGFARTLIEKIGPNGTSVIWILGQGLAALILLVRILIFLQKREKWA